jgi:hypothetical protein
MSWVDDFSPGFSGWRTWQATPTTALDVFCCRGRFSGPLALITAGVHGDEYEGPAAIHIFRSATQATAERKPLGGGPAGTDQVRPPSTVTAMLPVVSAALL